jgi:2-keto-3-deoxy-L-rhamnonate aldolase RhmA
MPAAFTLTALTTDPAVIRAADVAGVDRIGIDIERLGKHLRQDPAEGLRFSDHSLDDLAAVAANVRRAEIFVRVNPLHAGTREEVERALSLGARVLMLPYFEDPCQAAAFLEIVAGRARAILLIETGTAAARIREIVALPGVSEIMVGLNDLHRCLGLRHPFEVLTSDLILSIARHTRDAGLPFGFGGLGRAGDGTLPIASDLVYAQYPRLGATAAWLARSFYTGLAPHGIPAAVRELRDRLAWWSTQPDSILQARREHLAAALRTLPERRP